MIEQLDTKFIESLWHTTYLNEVSEDVYNNLLYGIDVSKSLSELRLALLINYHNILEEMQHPDVESRLEIIGNTGTGEMYKSMKSILLKGI